MPTSSLLTNSVSRYLCYVKEIDKNDFEIKGFPICLSNFESNFGVSLSNTAQIITSLHENNIKKKIIFYSLQNSEDNFNLREHWNTITLSILKSDANNIFVFLYHSGANNIETSKDIYKHLNTTDEQFCHSLLLRDIIKKNRIGCEIDIALENTHDIKMFQEVLLPKITNLVETIEFKFDIGLLKKIVDNINTYFPMASFEKNTYIELITDFYAYNLNCKSFKNIKEISKDLTIIIDNVDSSILSYSNHELYGSVIHEMKDFNCEKEISKLAKWLVYLNVISDMTKLLVYSNHYKPKILVLDDHIERIESEIKIIGEWLGEKSCVVDDDLKSSKDINDFFKNLSVSKPDDDNRKKIKDKDFLLIDLDYDGELKGFEYLRILRMIKSIYEKPYVIVFSRNEDPETVQKALNMGALFFASKQNFAHLLLEIYKILSLIEEGTPSASVEKKDYHFSLGYNWNLLYQLPLSKILELKTKVINGNIYSPFEKNSEDYGFSEINCEFDKDYKWIQKLPKAELHNHIGSVLGPELIPKTALIVLSLKYLKSKDYNNIGLIVDYLLPIVTDPFLFEEIEFDNNTGLQNSFMAKRCYDLKKLLIIDKSSQYLNQSIFTIVADSLNLSLQNKTPEEVLLSPEDDTLEKHFKPFSKLKYNKIFYEKKIKLKEKDIRYEEVMLFFILLLQIRESLLRSEESVTIDGILSKISDEILIVLNEEKEFITESLDLQKLKESMSQLSDELGKCLKIYLLKIDFYKRSKKSILCFLISAHSKQRCLPYNNKGLFNYLRGCEYGGAPHLQTKESIYLIAHHIIFEYAIRDNIRYLDLRCAIDGYNKFKLFGDSDKIETISSIVEVMEKAFTGWQNYALIKNNKKVHINLIVTAKRHKSLNEFERNVELTIKNFKLKKDNSHKKLLFFETPTEIVSFDIAGLEKYNRISRFKDQLKPLLDKCVPITMHAGEEDSHDAIREAFYLTHTQRLGHALTLIENEELMNLVRESFVNIELCPISNYLTNKKYFFEKNTEDKYVITKYPLRNYLRDRLSVSINTDNPYVSDSNLTKEYLFAAKLNGGLTKWQILKLILYSFKSVTIHKNLKSSLMKEINEDIFELMLEEDNFL